MTLGVEDMGLSAATEAIERGWIPDPAVRWGIRRLCAQRLREQATILHHDRHAHDRLMADLQAAAIAPVPEKANAQHYEVPAEFFRLMLGPRLKYSCCWWDEGTASLAAAEDASLRLTGEPRADRGRHAHSRARLRLGIADALAGRALSALHHRLGLELHEPAGVHRSGGARTAACRTSRSSPPT